jgi:23S rRNA (cytosine1962-C5)-methyltransferase
MGCGHYQVGSITVRMLSFDNSAMESGFWKQRIQEAFEARQNSGLFTGNSTNSYRLVHGEGDMLPGLVLDYYNGIVVLQAHSAGMLREREKIVSALRMVLGNLLLAVYDKSSSTAPFKAGIDLTEGYLYMKDGFAGSKGSILENGLGFNVDWQEGQKTGFFLDQRDNRALVRSCSNGRRVLNLFCYTGGFSVYAMAGGASLVHSVDSSAKAIEMTDLNIKSNLDGEGGFNHTSFCTDAIEFLKNSKDGDYDLMIVDPPAFAKHRDALKNALRAYQRLNFNAISKIAPGGLIFTFSCSQIVDKISFAEAVFSAAALSRRKVRIVGRLSQPSDHPVNIFHPEGEYLKGLVLLVD